MAKRISPYNNPNSLYGPYESIQEALDSIPVSLRTPGRTVGIKEGLEVIDYYFNSDIIPTLIERKTGSDVVVSPVTVSVDPPVGVPADGEEWIMIKQ